MCGRHTLKVLVDSGVSVFPVKQRYTTAFRSSPANHSSTAYVCVQRRDQPPSLSHSVSPHMPLFPVIAHLSVSFIAHTHTHLSCVSLSCFMLFPQLCSALCFSQQRLTPFQLSPFFSHSFHFSFTLPPVCSLAVPLSVSPLFSLFLSIYCIHSFHPFLIHLRSLRCQRCSPSLPPSCCISRGCLSTDSLELSAMRLQFTGSTHTQSHSHSDMYKLP